MSKYTPMTFNSRLAKLAEKLAEETFPLKMYLDESLPKLAQSSFTRGALHPTIEAAIRLDERIKTLDAAAPEMLAALKAALSSLENIIELHSDHPAASYARQNIKTVKDAIAKAEGRE